jgi:hypothetical protein
MAKLQRIPLESTISSGDDKEHNEALRAGVVLVETAETQAALSALPAADVDRLADAMNKLLEVLNAPGRHKSKRWSWHLALTYVPTTGGQPELGGGGRTPELGGSGRTPESKPR